MAAVVRARGLTKTFHTTERQPGLGIPGAVAAAAPLTGLAAFVGSRHLWNWSRRHYTGVNG